MVAAVVIGAGIAGCTERVAADPTSAAGESQGAAVEWNLKTPDGKELTSAEFKGKPHVLNFWATWCPPCVAEMPDLVKAQEGFEGRGLTIVGISLDRRADLVPPFAKKVGVNFPLAMDDGKLAAAYGVEVIPTTIVIDKDGQVRARHVGAITRAELEAMVKPVL